MISENAEKKEYLNRYKKATAQEKRIGENLSQLRLDMVMPSMISDGMPHGSGKSDYSSYMVMLEDLEQQYIRQRYKRIQIKKEIEDQIELLDDEKEKDILTYRYIWLYSWIRIASVTGYSESHAKRLHGHALKSFQIPKDDTK